MAVHPAQHRDHLHPAQIVRTPQNLRYTIHNKWGVMAGFEFLVDAQKYVKSLTSKWSMWDNDTGRMVRCAERQVVTTKH